MGDIITKQCDNCPTIKKEVNGWWLIQETSGGLYIIYPFHTVKQDFIEALKKDKQIFHYVCGQTCLIEKIGKIISKVGVENVPRNKPSTDGYNRCEESTILPMLAITTDDGS